MNTLSPGPCVATLPSLEDRIDEICDRFETLWRSGVEPRIEDFAASELPDETPTARRSLWEALVIGDLEYRWRPRRLEPACSTSTMQETVNLVPSIPERPLLADYATRYPALGPSETWTAALVAQEYRVRYRAGLQPDRDEYLRRYPHLAQALPRRLD